MDTLFNTSVYTAKPGMRERTRLKGKSGSLVAGRIKESLEVLPDLPDNYHLVNEPHQLRDIAECIEKAGAFVFDLETSDVNPWKSKIYSCGIRAYGQCFAIPFEHALQPTLDSRHFKDVLGKYFTDPDIKRMNHNLQFDCHFIEEQFGIPVGPLWCCTMLQSWVLDSEGAHGLKELSALYGIDAGGKNYTAQFGLTAWSHLPTKLANYYLCKDVDLVPKLYAIQQNALEAKPQLHKLFWELEMPMLNIVYEMERKGMRVDEDYFLNDLTPQTYVAYAKALEALKPIIEPYLHLLPKEMTVQEVTESHKALAIIFFQGRGLPKIKHVTLKMDTKKTLRSGQINPNYKKFTKLTLDKGATAALKAEREDMRLLAEFRKVNTRRKLVVDQIPALWTKHPDGTTRLHPSINEIGTGTGRQTIQRPNLQQQPPEVRQVFTPDEGNVFVGFDFSQQEMRLMAHYSRDQGLIDIFTVSKLDMYSQMAVDVFGLKAEEFVDEDVAKAHPVRKKTKTTVLGTSYGMMEAALSRRLGLTLSKGTEIYNRYFDTYPGILEYQARTSKFAQENRYIPTLLGRERPINPHVYGWERAAMNQPIQGSAADQCKLAAVKCDRLIRENGWPIRIWLMVHDEIIFEANKVWVERNKDAILQIKQTMETALPLIVPVTCHYVIEDRWGTKSAVRWDEDKADFEEEAA